MADLSPRSLYTTSITQSEIYHGLLLLSPGRRRTALKESAEVMFQQDFKGGVLSFSGDAALPYAEIATERQRAGRPISQSDAQIAAIANCVGAAVATRHVADFELCGVSLINPWEF